MPVNVDTTPPVCSVVIVNNNSDNSRITFTKDPTKMTASWHCEDAAPWVASSVTCEWAIGTYPGGDDFVSWEPVPSSAKHFEYHANETSETTEGSTLWYTEEDNTPRWYMKDSLLRNGLIYFASIRCLDQVQLTASSVAAGLLPDLVAPRVAVQPMVTQPSNGKRAYYWGSNTTLYGIWDYEAFESGLRSMRGALVEEGYPPPYLQMPLELPITMQDRSAELSLGTLGASLKHNTVYNWHVCAEDNVGHVGCATPNSFLLDLTPPVYNVSNDIISRLHAPPCFNTRAGYQGEWRCDDPESGVAYTSWMPYVHSYSPGSADLTSEALLTRRWFSVGVMGIGIGSGSTAKVLKHGGLYYGCVTATNRAQSPSTFEPCSTGTIFDGFAPVIKTGRFLDFGGKRFVAGLSQLCSDYPVFLEDVSPLTKMEHELVRVWNGESIVVQTVEVNVSRSLSGGEHCVSLDSPLQHRERYFSQIRLTDSAFNVRHIKTRGFRVDVTPPSPGNVTAVTPIFPDSFASQNEFSSVSGLRVRVEFDRGYDGFDDEDSGVAHVDVQVYGDGVLITSGVAYPGQDEWESPALSAIANGVVLQAFCCA